MAAYALTENDKRVLQRWLDWAKGQPTSGPRGAGDAEEPTSPEIYLAKTPAGGIPARTAGTPPAGDKPGQADCLIWRIRVTPSGPELHEVGALSKTVYNFTTTAVLGDDFVLTTRDKLGAWIAVPSGGAAAGGVPIRVSSSTPGADGLYDGFLLSYNAALNTFTDGTAIKVRDLNAAP
jgi:hypothetical protein